MGSSTPLIKAHSTLPSLGRARHGQAAELPDGSYRATLVFGSSNPRSDAAAKGNGAARDGASPAPHPGSVEARSWSYLATEGGKGKAARPG